MLVLRRRAGESIRIGDGIEVVVLEVGPNRVKLGVEAPADITVLRGEVALTRDENTRAASYAASAADLESLAKKISKTL